MPFVNRYSYTVTVRVLATGGRGFPRRDAVARALAHVEALFPHTAPGDFILVHGNCKFRRPDGTIDYDRSADQLALQEAVKRGWQTEAHPVDWDSIPRSQYSAAGRGRNEHMVSLGAAICIAFPGGGGTRNCRNTAERAGIPVIRLADVPV